MIIGILHKKIYTYVMLENVLPHFQPGTFTSFFVLQLKSKHMKKKQETVALVNIHIFSCAKK